MIGRKAIIALAGVTFAFSSVAAFAQTTRPVAPMPSVQETPAARALVRIDGLEDQLRALTDRIERAEANLEQQKAENARLAHIIDELQAKTTTASPSEAANSNDTTAGENTATNAAGANETPVKAVEPEVQAPAAAPNPAPAIEATTTTASATPAAATTPAPAPVVQTPPKTPQILLAEARLNIQRGEFQIAEEKLAQITENSPNAPEVLDAQWLLGETRYVQHAYAPAAQAYVAYLQKAPNGPKMPDALIKLASSFRELGDNRQRCLALSEYSRRTPNPTTVQKALAEAEIARGTCP